MVCSKDWFHLSNQSVLPTFRGAKSISIGVIFDGAFNEWKDEANAIEAVTVGSELTTKHGGYFGGSSLLLRYDNVSVANASSSRTGTMAIHFRLFGLRCELAIDSVVELQVKPLSTCAPVLDLALSLRSIDDRYSDKYIISATEKLKTANEWQVVQYKIDSIYKSFCEKYPDCGTIAAASLGLVMCSLGDILVGEVKLASVQSVSNHDQIVTNQYHVRLNDKENVHISCTGSLHNNTVDLGWKDEDAVFWQIYANQTWNGTAHTNIYRINDANTHMTSDRLLYVQLHGYNHLHCVISQLDIFIHC